MNTLSDALKKALDARKNDYSSFIWKGEKQKEGDKYVQTSIRMIDMSDKELQKCYDQCNLMLHNTNPKNLGRYNVLDEVSEQIDKCNVELLLRYFENSYQNDENRNIIKRFTLMVNLRQLMKNNPDIEDWSVVPITQITSNLPEEFHDINIAEVLDACIDGLGAFNKQHLTMTFITKMGVWLTRQEKKELQNDAPSNADKLKVIKERLHLPTKLVLKFREKGLSYHEMRAMLTLPKHQKYSDMTTEQLITLRNKVLLRYQREIDSHIFSWNRLKKQLELVANSRNIELV